MASSKRKPSRKSSTKSSSGQKRSAPPETVYLPPEHQDALKNLQALAPHVKKSRLIAEAILHMWEDAQRFGFDGGKLRPIGIEAQQGKKASLLLSKKASGLSS